MKKNFTAIAALLAVAVLLSLFTVSVFATEGTTTPEETPAEEEVVTTPAEDAAETTPSSTTAGSTTAATTTTSSSTTTTNGPTLIEIIIPLAILVVAVVVLVVVFFGLPKYRTKTLAFCRSIKSECGKVSWYSWKNTRKGTVVVVICVVALAIVIGLLDWLFFTVIDAIPGLF